MALPSEYDSKFWLALLHELDASGGADSPSKIYPRMRQYFPGITDQDTQIRTKNGDDNKWTNSIRWARQLLVDCGCIDNSIHGQWVLTDAGRRWLVANWNGPDSDYSQARKPSIVKASKRPKPALTIGPTAGTRRKNSTAPAPALPAAAISQTSQPGLVTQLSATPAATAPLVVIDPVAQLCQELRSTQRLSNTPQRFEYALSNAFAFLGFNTKHIGGASEPDIFVEAVLGQSTYSVIVDAKSTQSGKVPDGQINWPVIDSYRQKRSATFAAVVGEDFSGGQLQTFATQYKVALITTDMLCDLIRLHDEAPFNLHDLRELFAVIGRADPGVQALKDRFSRNRQHWQLVSEIVDTIDGFQQIPSDGTAHTVGNLYYYLKYKNGRTSSAAPTLQDLTDAIGFLASKAVNILVEVPGANGEYQLAMRASTARKRLLALARSIDASASVSAGVVAMTKSGP